MNTSPATTVHLDFTTSTGPIRAIHGVNKGPLVGNGVNYNDHSAYFKEIGFPTVRLHDIPSDWRQSVDVPCIFPLFHLDPQDPRNYDFRRTDVYIRSIIECGSGVVYRLGVQIERAELNFDVDPPADVDRWIEVCANIIRHYNEGWGNGFHYGIRYWEIWNEPDNGPGQWNGTFEEFTAFYIKVATRLKALFPDLMIGGPALNGAMMHCPRQKLEEFLPHVKVAGAPLDFLSWHAYPGDGADNAGDQVKAVAESRDDAGTARSLTGALRVLAGAAREVRQTLDAYGFTATASHLNEWNLAPLQWGFQAPEVAEAYLAEKRGPLGSAVIAATLSVLQNEPVDMTNFYTAARRGYGIFDDFGRPYKPFYAFRAFKMMLKDTPNRCPISGSDLESGHTVLAGISADGDVVQVLLSNCGGTPWQPRISLCGLTAAPASLSSLVIDAPRNLEADPADPTLLDGSDIVTTIPPHTVRLVRLNIR